MNLLRIFFFGLVISLLGTLPLGTLNVSAMQLSATRGVLPAVYFSVGALLVEMIYVRLSLATMDFFRKKSGWFRIMEWVSLLIIAALAVGSLVGAGVERPVSILDSGLPPFWSGVFLSAVNPLQIPFWFGWSAFLFSRKQRVPGTWVYPLYITGIGLGTFLGNGIFIWGGFVLVNTLQVSNHLMQGIAGGAFALAALVQGYRMYFRKPSPKP